MCLGSSQPQRVVLSALARANEIINSKLSELHNLRMLPQSFLISFQFLMKLNRRKKELQIERLFENKIIEIDRKII
jgi:hypothetical protein